MPLPTSPLSLFFGTLSIIASLGVTVHALLWRRNHHAVVWWIGVAWVIPLAGPLLYLIFGINRIERKAIRLRRDLLPKMESPNLILSNSIDEKSVSYDMRQLLSLCRVVENISQLPLTRGNRVSPLFNGDEAYPAMLSAINKSKKSIGLSTYIFENDPVGGKFVEALSHAVRRGVEVRVLIDDVGAGLKWKSIQRELQKAGVPVAYFMPTLAPWRMAYLNLRNHRKILTVDGKILFSGGMNITSNHEINSQPRHPAIDVHFQIEGPVVAQAQETFRHDWHFTVGEDLRGDAWFPALYESGITFARGIADGPDEEFERCKSTLLAALANARRCVRILTPYLIPEPSLISALNLASLSGVQVDIILPSNNDMKIVHWATQATLWQILQRGVRVWRTKGPFNHAKLMVIDGGWTHIGSSNWDHRSLRLNFEFNVECYGRELAEKMELYIDQQIANAHRITLQEVDGRSWPIRLRDGVARLFTPLL